MLSWTSPSAFLQSTSVSQREALHVSHALVFTSGALILQLWPRGHPLLICLCWSRVLSFLGSIGTVPVRQLLAGYHPLVDWGTPLPPSLSVKEASLLVLELWPEGQA